MGHQVRMNRIEEHFRSVSSEKVEASLIKAGAERIAPAVRYKKPLLTEKEWKAGFRYESEKMLGYRVKEGYQTFILSSVSLRPVDAT